MHDLSIVRQSWKEIEREEDRLAGMPNYSVLPLDLEVVKMAYGLRILADPSDRLIAATALALGLPLITADSTIADSGLVPIIW